MASETVLITGAAGRIGTFLRPRLAQPGRLLRLLDTQPIDDSTSGEEAVTVSIDDLSALKTAFIGVDKVVHLAAIATEARWEDILRVNINGTRNVFEAARVNGVRNVVFASSNHAVGFFPKKFEFVPEYEFPLPDTNYGVSKVAGEAIASLYTSRYGINTVSIRILSCFEKPLDTRMLSTWLSPDDAGRLFEAALGAEGQHVVWGASKNTRSWVSLDAAMRLGYEPRDDAERFAADLIAEFGEPRPESLEETYLGGRFCGPEFDPASFEGP